MITLIKRCKRHGILLGENADRLETDFTETFPAARFDPEAKEWVIPWEKGFYARSNAVLEQFFVARGETLSHIDEC